MPTKLIILATWAGRKTEQPSMETGNSSFQQEP